MTGQLARRCGVNVETIRYYEQIAILPAPDRTEGGRRSYGYEEVRRLAFIRRARELGFSLIDIRSLIDLADPDSPSCVDICAVAGNHLAQVRSKIADLRRLEHELIASMGRCGSGAAAGCGVLDALWGTEPGEATQPAGHA